MKKHNKIIITAVLALVIVTVLCSCGAPNTVSTDTKYKLTLLTNVYPDASGAEMYKRAEFALSGSTVSGCAWSALKEYQKKTYDNTTKDTLAAIKYYTPSEAKGTDTVTYSAAFTASAKKQLELAAAGGAELIVVSGEEFTNAYLDVKDTTKTFGEITFVLLTAPGAKTAEAATLNAKTTAVVIDVEQLGYLFGYYAVQNGFKKIGYAALEGGASAAFAAGLKEGAEAAGDAEILTSFTTSGPVDNVIKDDIAKISDKADLLIGDETTASYIAETGKKYASIYKDEKAEFSISLNAEVLTAKLADIINTARQSNAASVKRLGAADGIYVYSKDSALVQVPELSLSSNSTPAETTAAETTN